MRPVSWLPGLPAAIALMALLPSAATAGGGTVTGRFMLAGEVPATCVLIAKGASVKDSCVCAAETMLRNDLVIDKATKGIRHIFVYLQRAPAQHQVPEAQRKPLPEVVVRVKHCRYEPHTLIARTGQTVRVKFADNVVHNPHVYWLRNNPVGFLIRPNDGKGVPVTPRVGELLPIQVKCDIYPWMLSYWLILDHPYGTVTRADGTFRIEKLPAGKHDFRVWHERVGYVNAGERRGFEVTVEDGETADIGTITLPLSLFQQD